MDAALCSSNNKKHIPNWRYPLSVSYEYFWIYNHIRSEWPRLAANLRYLSQLRYDMSPSLSLAALRDPCPRVWFLLACSAKCCEVWYHDGRCCFRAGIGFPPGFIRLFYAWIMETWGALAGDGRVWQDDLAFQKVSHPTGLVGGSSLGWGLQDLLRTFLEPNKWSCCLTLCESRSADSCDGLLAARNQSPAKPLLSANGSSFWRLPLFHYGGPQRHRCPQSPFPAVCFHWIISLFSFPSLCSSSWTHSLRSYSCSSALNRFAFQPHSSYRHIDCLCFSAL